MPRPCNTIFPSLSKSFLKHIYALKVSSLFTWLFLSPITLVSTSMADVVPGKDGKTVRNRSSVIKRSITAYGGQAKILSLKSFLFEYQVKSVSPKTAEPIFMRTYFKDTDFFRSEVIDGRFQVITVLDKNQGFVEVDGTKISRPAKSLSPLRNETLSFLRPDLLLLIFSKYRYSGRIKEEGRSLEQVLISGFIDNEYIRGRLSINSKNFFVEKYEFEIERETKDGIGIFRGQNRYLKYNQFDGFKLPHEIISQRPTKTSRILVTAVTLNKGPEKKIFQNITEPIPNKNKSAN